MTFEKLSFDGSVPGWADVLSRVRTGDFVRK